MNDIPTHLLLPLLASLLFVCGLLFIKRATMVGANPWTVTFLANQWAAIIFSTFWLLGGEGQPTPKLWQPAIIAMLYILGQVFTFSAIQRGDVSVATPVFGIKVVLVAVFVTVLFGEALLPSTWFAAAIATVGIGLVQWTPPNKANVTHSKRNVLVTVVLAATAAAAFATFDVLLQSWAPAWGSGRFLPIVYWMVAALSILFLPFVQPQLLRETKTRRTLLFGTLLIALQALCIVFTLATYGDVARVNVVYAMRGMWGVVLAWSVAVIWGGNEATLPRKVMFARLIGAGLLTLAVVVVVLVGR